MPRESARLCTTRSSIANRSVAAILGLCLLMSGSGVLGQQSQTSTATAVLAKCQQCHGETVQMSHLSMATRDSILRVAIMARPSFPATRPTACSTSASPVRCCRPCRWRRCRG